jgi:hypothetical protein
MGANFSGADTIDGRVDQVMAEVRQDVEDLVRTFWCDLCAAAPEYVPVTIDLDFLERAQVAAQRSPISNTRSKLVEHFGLLALVQPCLRDQRELPN